MSVGRGAIGKGMLRGCQGPEAARGVGRKMWGGLTGRRGWGGQGGQEGGGGRERQFKEEREGEMERGERAWDGEARGWEGETGRGRKRDKRRGDFTDGYDGMPGWT